MYIAEEEVAHAAAPRTWYKSRGSVVFPATKLTNQDP